MHMALITSWSKGGHTKLSIQRMRLLYAADWILQLRLFSLKPVEL